MLNELQPFIEKRSKGIDLNKDEINKLTGVLEVKYEDINAKKYVEMIKGLFKKDEKQRDFYEWALKNGKQFNTIVNKPIKNLDFSPKIKQCFYNSQRIALFNKVKYFEGWAISKLIHLPVEHAWNVIDGKVLDSTWGDGIDYFGIEIPNNFISKYWLKTKSADNLLIPYYIQEVLKVKP